MAIVAIIGIFLILGFIYIDTIKPGFFYLIMDIITGNKQYLSDDFNSSYLCEKKDYDKTSANHNTICKCSSRSNGCGCSNANDSMDT